MTLLQLLQAQLTFWICVIASHAYLFIYLFIFYLRICTRCTGAKTIGHKSPTPVRLRSIIQDKTRQDNFI